MTINDLDAHADQLAGFYRRLLDADVGENVAGVLTIDLQKAVIAGQLPEQPGATAEDRQAAAQAKAERRAAELAQLEDTGQ